MRGRVIIIRAHARCARARLAQPDGRAMDALRAPHLRTLPCNALATYGNSDLCGRAGGKSCVKLS